MKSATKKNIRPFGHHGWINIIFYLRKNLLGKKKKQKSQKLFSKCQGSKIPGHSYRPLAEKIQALFPGSLWIGITDGFLVDMPNPVEISSAINGCLEDARLSFVLHSLLKTSWYYRPKLEGQKIVNHCTCKVENHWTE